MDGAQNYLDHNGDWMFTNVTHNFINIQGVR